MLNLVAFSTPSLRILLRCQELPCSRTADQIRAILADRGGH